MYDVNYTLTEALENYQQMISDYSVFLFLFLAFSVFGFLLWINRKEKTTFYFTLGSLFLMIIMTIYFRKLELLTYITTIFTRNFYKNLYFYHWNMIVCFLLMHIQISSKKVTELTRFIVIVFFVILATNLSFQLYMSDYVGNSSIMVLGNTGSMIVVGNILSFLLYLYLIVFYVVSCVKDRKR